MMNAHAKRKARIRAKISGNAERPRITVFRSNKYLYLQAIDDEKGKTLAAANTIKDKTPAATLAKALAALKIKKVVFDRAGFRFHGKVKNIAEELRKEGLEF